MATYASGVSSQNRNPQSTGFLLLDNSTLISSVSAVEPLHMVSQLSRHELYRWHTLNLDGRQIWVSDGLQITPDTSISNAPAVDCVIVCGGVDTQRSVTREHVTLLQTQARQGRRLGTICTDSWALARAGLLDDCNRSVHWGCLAAMREAFPWVAISTRLFSIDRNRFIPSGSTAPVDMMLCLIGHEHGRGLSAAVSEMFTYGRIRNERDHQRVPSRHILGTNQPKLQEIVVLMEVNLEEPTDLDELAVYVNVSRRQPERLFQKYLYCSPSCYCLKLRLIHARQLPKQTPTSVIEAASVCDSVPTPHFSRCYRGYFGVPSYDEHQDQPLGQPVVLMPIPQDLALMSGPSALSALSRAQDKSVFASVRI